MSLDDFLGHSGNAGGGGFLEKWREDGEIDVFLHPRGLPAALWAHSWYKITTYKDKKLDRDVTKIFSDDFNCLETEQILRKQKFRDDDDRREHPPAVCPLCLTIEWIRDQINDQKLDWLTPIFQFDAPGEPSTIVRAGGFCGLFKEPKQGFSEEDQLALDSIKVKQSEVFKQESAAKLQYIFRVVSAKDPGAGCLITRESQTLGQRVQKVIKDLMADIGEGGDPRIHPYGFHWTYDKNKTFADKYDAVRRQSIQLTPQIQAVFEQAPPDISDMLRAGDPRKLRASMEAHALIEFPWDELFGPAMAIIDELDAEPEEPWKDELGAAREQKRQAASSSAPSVQSAPAVEPPEEVACDKCEGTMTTVMDTCPHCGARYDLKTGMLIPDPPKQEPAKPPPRRRSAAASPPTSAVAPSTPAAPQAGTGAAPAASFRSPSRRRGG
jgi:hypothetical protein